MAGLMNDEDELEKRRLAAALQNRFRQIRPEPRYSHTDKATREDELGKRRRAYLRQVGRLTPK